MGNQVNISILTDHFDWIEKNPKTFVKAIKHGMNSGTESHVDACLTRRAAQDRGEKFYDPHWHESGAEREARRHYVTVHRYRHADEHQVTYSHANSSYDLYDITRGVELGYLDTVSNPETYVRIYGDIAKELRRQAKALDEATKRWSAEHLTESAE